MVTGSLRPWRTRGLSRRTSAATLYRPPRTSNALVVITSRTVWRRSAGVENFPNHRVLQPEYRGTVGPCRSHDITVPFLSSA